MVEIAYKGRVIPDSPNDHVKEYEGTLNFRIGSGKVHKNFEKQILGMRQGEKREFNLILEQLNQHLIIVKKRSEISLGEELFQGKILRLSFKNRIQSIGTILEVRDEYIIIDLNSPFAGKKLYFEVEIISVS